MIDVVIPRACAFTAGQMVSRRLMELPSFGHGLFCVGVERGRKMGKGLTEGENWLMSINSAANYK